MSFKFTLDIITSFELAWSKLSSGSNRIPSLGWPQMKGGECLERLCPFASKSKQRFVGQEFYCILCAELEPSECSLEFLYLHGLPHPPKFHVTLSNDNNTLLVTVSEVFACFLYPPPISLQYRWSRGSFPHFHLKVRALRLRVASSK